MKIKITSGFCLGSGWDVFPGDVIEASDKEAAIHIQRGRAVKAEAKDIKKAQAAMEAHEARADAEAQAAREAQANNDGGQP